MVVEKPVTRTEKVVETVVVEKMVKGEIVKVVETVVVEKQVTRIEKVVETVVVDRVVVATARTRPARRSPVHVGRYFETGCPRTRQPQ